MKIILFTFVLYRFFVLFVSSCLGGNCGSEIDVRRSRGVAEEIAIEPYQTPAGIAKRVH